MLQFLSISEAFSEIGKAILSFNSISDVLDVLLVAFVIYSAIKLIRETRAIQLAKGFVLLLAVYALVYVLNMQVSTYMFSVIFSNILLVLVVIFHRKFATRSKASAAAAFPILISSALKTARSFADRKFIKI